MSPETFWFVVLALVVGNQIIIGLFCRYLAEQKNRDGFVWFWLGFLFGPMPVALLTLIGLPVVSAEESRLRQRLRSSATLKEISLQEAMLLAGHKGEVCLDGLATLSDEAAKALAQYQGGYLSLSGLSTLSDEAAKALAQHQGGYLSLNGLTTLSIEAAKCLAQHDGELSLNGLTTLSVEAAKFLAQHDGWLSLNGLTTLSIDVAKSLAQHTGGLDLNGLTTLSDEAAKALRANPRVNMPQKFRR